MNFLKTLLVYMSLTFAMGVQQADAPDPAKLPKPTAAPTAVVQQTDSPVIATPAAVTPVPEKTEKPKPTMTPNAKYTKCQYGDKNNNVKKLQQKLIELGYLSKGDADGSYGYKTMRAVRAFQKANGLTSDGIAGKATLTHLYEDKNVVANPDAKATATPKATATGKPTAAAETGMTKATEAPVSTLTASWYKTNAKVLLNSNMIVLLARSNGNIVQRNPAVYLHDNAPMISLNDLTSAAGDWTLESSNGSACKLTMAGYNIVLTSLRGTTGDSDSYQISVDGHEVVLEDGSVVYADGVWYCSESFLEKTINAVVNWDKDENTLVLRVTDKSAAQTGD